MFRTRPEKPEQGRLLLNRGLLETCPPELRQSLAYMLHLRSHWKPEGRTKLIVPTSWMEFLTLADGKCGMECVAVQCCPFRNVRFESVAKACLVVPGEELPRDIVSRLLTNIGMDGCLPTLVPRAFEGIPRTSSRSCVPVMSHAQCTLRRIDFALVSENGVCPPENNTRCLLLGMKDPFQVQHSPSASFDPCSPPLALTSIPEEFTCHVQFHLTLLASLMKGGVAETATERFPEWLILFGLTYDAHHIRVIAYLPHRQQLDVIDCAAYIVDELPLRSGPVASLPRCELVLERLRLLLALTTIRRHVLHLSKSLFSAITPCDGIGRISDGLGHPSLLTCDEDSFDDFELLQGRSSFGSSDSEYSTCPSSVHVRELNDAPAFECREEFSSSCKSFACSFCSTCSSLLGSDNTSDSFYSDSSKYTNSNYMEPSTIAISQEGNEDVAFACPNKLTVTKRRAIIAWAREIVPTEHPIQDTYRMDIRHPHPIRRRLGDPKSGTRI